MGDGKWSIVQYRKSVYFKVLFLFVSSFTLLIILMGFFNLYVIRQYRERAEDLYQNSLEFYGSFWDEKLSSVNSSLLALVSLEGGSEFNYICNSDDRLLVETSKVNMRTELTKMAYLYENEVRFWVYVPERSIFVKSSNRLGSFDHTVQADLDVKKYIADRPIRNNSQWELLECDGVLYFIQVYHMGEGYVGAMMECERVLASLFTEEMGMSAAVLDAEGQMVIQMGEELSVDQDTVFAQPLTLTGYQLAVIVARDQLHNEGNFLLLITVCSLIFGVLIVVWNMRFQVNVIFRPLDKLRSAMEKFSKGDTQVRLEEYPVNNEIKVLYGTFNHMAEEIVDLAIDVYEGMLHQQRIESNYLRVQIQPHFYTNVLNLIYGMAEIRDFEGIQELSVHMSAYFRYLLSNKEEFVPLGRELECVENYVKIQQIRYPDFLETRMKIEADERQFLIPPLFLQTFLENSIMHNITLVPKLEVGIAVRVREEQMELRIWDTGSGFPQQILERLNSGEDIEEEGRHIGIVNIKNRLKLLYQGDGTIRMYNREEGAVVELCLPVKTAGGDKKDEPFIGG